MALVTTTLNGAVGASQTFVVLTSATGLAAGMLILADDEVMKVTKDYVSGTTANVLRGQNGSVQKAHVTGAFATYGVPGDFGDPAPGAHGPAHSPIMSFYTASVTATSTLTLPPPKSIAFIGLNGTSAITLTIPVPTGDMDGTIMFLLANGVAQHVLTFTSGLSGVGTGYTTVTGASAAKQSIMVVAYGGYWNAISAPVWTGTMTKLGGALA